MLPSLRSSQVRSPSGHASLLLQDSFQAEGPMGRATVLKSYWPCHAPCTGQRSSRGFAGHATLFLQNSSQIRGSTGHNTIPLQGIFQVSGPTAMSRLSA